MDNNNGPKARYASTVQYLLFVLLLVFFVYQNVDWVLKYRFDQALDIDESGYLALAVSFAKAKASGGWIGWWHAVSAPLGFAPLVPLITSIAMIAFGINENLGFLCNIGFAAGTIILMFAAVRRYSLPHALLASLLLISLPNFVMFSRSFQFVSATTFFFFSAFACFVLSDGLQRRTYSVLMGAALGCMILSRTMALAFLPAFVVAFLAYLFWIRDFSKATIRNIVASIAAFMIVALPWYLGNYKSVFGYLFSFGYGAHAAEYGHSHGIFTLENLKSRLDVIVSQVRPGYFFAVVPLFAVIVVLVLLSRKRDARSGMIICGSIVSLVCFFILSTSQNMGTGFDAPIYPIVTFCVTIWLAGIAFRWVQALYFTLAVMLFSVASYAHQDLYRCMRMPRMFSIGFAGYPPLVNCLANIHGYLRTNEFSPPGDVDFILDRREAIEWRDLNRSVASFLIKEDSNRGNILLVSRHMLVNVNSIELEMIKGDGFILPMVQIDPAVLAPTVESYSRWLAQPPQDSACLALTLDDQHGEFFPRADMAMMVSAMKQAKFERMSEFSTPRPGQHLVVWRRRVPACQSLAAEK
jgi:hypothetical protein